MADFLLDTNAVSALMKADADLMAWLAARPAADRLFTCPIVRGEILFGIRRLASGKRREELNARAHDVLAALPCTPIPEAAADIYASTKAARQLAGLVLDENDLWVASTAMALKATLVSRD